MSFDIKSHLPKGVADALFTEDDDQPESVKPQRSIPPVKPSVPLTFGTTPTLITSTPLPTSYVSTISSVDNPLLDELRTKSSFESTPLGQQLQSFITGLEDTGLPETQKMKTALKLSHITAASVIDTLNGLQAVLAADKQKFDAQMIAASTTEVDGRQQKMANIDSQINDLESQLNALRHNKSDLAAEIDSKTHQIQSLKDNYRSAFDTRTAEINTQISHYQSILQG